MSRLIVIGCGNTLRGDDGAGIFAVRLLREQLGPTEDVRVVEAERAGLGIVDLLRDCDVAVIVDTIVAGAEPGMIHHVDGRADRVGLGAALSSHGEGLAGALAIGQALFGEQMPATISIWGLEPETVAFGEALSPAVAAALPELVRRVREELRALVVPGTRAHEQGYTGCAGCAAGLRQDLQDG